MLATIQTDPITILVHDSKLDSIETQITIQKTLQLPIAIELNENIRVELIGGYYAIDDGLVNARWLGKRCKHCPISFR